MTEARVPVTDDALVEKVARAMANAVIRDDEGEFPRLFDLLDFSGENKAWTIAYGLARAAIAIAYPAGVAAGREEAQAEIGKLRAALIAMGRMLPSVILDDRVSTDFLCELPAEMGHYRLTAPSEIAAIRERGK